MQFLKQKATKILFLGDGQRTYFMTNISPPVSGPSTIPVGSNATEFKNRYVI